MKAVCPFFVFKQKTEYELRISDWSSDVCASDLGPSSTSTPRCATLSATPACAMLLPPLPPQAACRDAASMPGRWNLPRTTGAENHDRGGAPARLRAGPAGGTHRRLVAARSEEHTSELQSLMRISYAVFCLKKKKKQIA